MNINKDHITDRLIKKTGLRKKEAQAAVSGVFEIICDELSKGNNIFLRNQFGLQVVRRKPRSARDINAGKIHYLPERMSIKFAPSDKLKLAINENI